MHARFKPSKRNSHFPHPNPTSFATYIEYYQKLIAEVRSENSYHETPNIIEKICPYELGPSTAKKGILLIHGLLDTPYLMHDIGVYFAKKGYLIRSILLPGHGTIPGDLAKVKLSEWHKAYQFAIKMMQEDLEEFSIIAFSTGAAISLSECLQHTPHKLKKLILLSPAIKISYRPWYSASGRLLGKLWKRALWFRIMKDDDFARHYSLPLHAAHQVYLLTKKIQKQQKQQLQIPLFIAASYDDVTASCSGTMDFFNKQKNPANRLLIYIAQNLRHPDPRVEFVNSRYPELKIAHFSHVCLSVAPENPHYGKDGDYQVVLKPFAPYKLYGEQLHSLAVTHRLTYNPDFYPMMKRIENFIEDAPHAPGLTD